ncbi:MAG: polysulfide reductase NrfD [Chloroflexi bacterium]|nr:polysulfide reductase NrfD [Chloroflexota bacterium]
MEAIGPVRGFRSVLESKASAPLERTSRAYYLFIGVLALIIAWGLFAYVLQLREGLILTGMRDRVPWGLYITMYVFFIGVSMAGTFISAILRITKAGWRTPVTRAAEIVTVSSLIVAAMFIVFNSRQNPHLTLYKVIFHGRWESPVIWDVLGLATYLAGSVTYLYAALIPDMAFLRDTIGPRSNRLKRWAFNAFSLGWRDTPRQRRDLQRALGLMMILIIPVAVTMHTVTSWLFAMTLREPWHSPMFGIYFVAGAVFSGVGIIVILIAILRKLLGLEEYITKKHFLYLGYILAAFSGAMFFLNVNEFVVHGYTLGGKIDLYLDDLLTGTMAPLYWGYFWGGIVLPVVIIAVPFTRTIAGVVVASVLVNVGMFIERYLIVVGGARLPLNPYDMPSYSPSWIEVSVTVGGIAAFILIIAVLLKLVPSVAVWEMVEGHSAEAGAGGAHPARGPLAPEGGRA